MAVMDVLSTLNRHSKLFIICYNLFFLLFKEVLAPSGGRHPYLIKPFGRLRLFLPLTTLPPPILPFIFFIILSISV